MRKLWSVLLVATAVGCGGTSPDLDGEGAGGDASESGSDAAPGDSSMQFPPDADSDGDSILDQQEGTADPDQDMVPAYLDPDSDGDCRPDALEAGDGLTATWPVDTDADGTPDFLDRDSDDDGLADGAEDVDCDASVDPGESDATLADSDGDGASDLVEDAAGTGIQDPTDNPQARGDFVFLEPYQAAPSPLEDRLDFATAFRNVDLYFFVDVSGSMYDEANAIKSSIESVIDALVCGAGEDPVATGCIPSLQTGVARYGYKNTHTLAEPMEQLKEVSPVNLVGDGPGSTQSFLPLPPLSGSGSDEWHITGMHHAIGGTCATDPTRLGRACFRNDSLRLIAMFTDEQFSEDNQWPGSVGGYLDNLANANLNVIGVYSDSSNAASLADEMATGLVGGNPLRNLVPALTSTSIGTVACAALSGNPFHLMRAVIYGQGSSAANALTCAVQGVTQFVSQDVRADLVNDPANVDAQGNPVNAPAAFVDHVEVFMDGTASCPTHGNVQDANADGAPDVFIGILPGAGVCWKVFVKSNVTVAPGAGAQMFRATIRVVGNGNTLLDERDVYFLVPPAPPDDPID